MTIGLTDDIDLINSNGQEFLDVESLRRHVLIGKGSELHMMQLTLTNHIRR